MYYESSKIEEKNFMENLEANIIQRINIDLMNLQLSKKELQITKKQANQILDKVREGQVFPQRKLLLCLMKSEGFF